MQNTEYLELVETSGDREKNYARVVDRYYELVTPMCRDVWSDSFHLAWFTEGQQLPEAQSALQRWLADRGGFAAGDALLDVGCGIGGPAAAIAEYTGADVTGVNICGHQVRVARAMNRTGDVGRRLTFVEADAMALPFAPAAFDGAFSIEALCYTPDKDRAYAEVAKVLKGGGAFVGVDWFCADDLSDADYERWVEPMCRAFAIPRLIPFGAVEGHLEAAGFEVESVSRYSDHGDIEPNWRLCAANSASAAGGNGSDTPTESFETLLQASVPALRDACREGKVIMGCWVAHRRG
ncbi:class I SAM-dependent methyltransferase [Streptomyces sp. SID3343]|uniref:SAM-dependent methyltransferase n=1 Tax=Streptomyces sp. SID3343 TaxID=2690260 RepID=UPI00136EF310|nr:class I SAM-dependent methyltransferase [Streptomyces sp. SID3343]MYW00627.1 methyltransferase domain-containing protein [Streptomyces sp. SID3343]MYW06302.1 methyltransferase domain-containing protein [Streptomyces sp. SID3343]